MQKEGFEPSSPYSFSSPVSLCAAKPWPRTVHPNPTERDASGELQDIAEQKREVWKGRRPAILKLQSPAILMQKLGRNRRESSEES